MTGNEKYVYNLTGTVYIRVHNMYSVHTHFENLKITLKTGNN